MKPSDQHAQQPTPTHDPRTCGLCGTLRHPAQAAQGRSLRRYLAANPLPRQALTQ